MKVIDVKAYGLKEKPVVDYTWRNGLNLLPRVLGVRDHPIHYG
jgi:hypothetical protein